MMAACAALLVFLVTTPIVGSTASAAKADAVCPTSGNHDDIAGTSRTATSATAPVTYSEVSKFGSNNYNPGSLCGLDAGAVAAKPASGNTWSAAQAEKLIAASTAGGVLRYAFTGASSLLDIVPLLWVAGGFILASLVGYSGYKEQFA